MGLAIGRGVEDTANGHVEDDGVVRKFATGATRSSGDGKADYEGFLSPQVIVRFGEYMMKHQYQADGSLRDSDNWQKGIPRDQYIKSMFRHYVDLWNLHRADKQGAEVEIGDVEEALCALLFNVQGYLYEYLNDR